nr:tetratricopeptide repeat protein [Allomuricauda sp.]
MFRTTPQKYIPLFLLLVGCLFSDDALGQVSRTEDTLNKSSDSIFLALKLRMEEAQREGLWREITQSHLEFGEFYRRAEVYPEAIDEFNTALKLIGTNTDDTLYVKLNNCIGKVHLSLNKFELAKQYLEESLSTSINLNYAHGQAISQGLLGACFEKQGDYLQALTHQKESLRLLEDLKDVEGISVANENIGSIYEDLAQYDLAREFFLKSYEYVKDKKVWREANVLNNLADVYRKKGDYENALVFTNQALDIAKEIGDNHQLESAHKDLSKAYALMEDYESAHYHLSEAERYNKARQESQNTNQLNILQTVYETNKKETQIQLLREQNKVSRANQTILWLVLFTMVVIGLILYNYMGRKRKGKLKIQEYKQRMLKAELDKKAYEEKNLQREVQLKTAALSRYSLHLSQKNKILQDLSKTLKNIAARKNMDSSTTIKDLAKEIEFNLQQEDEWDEFMNFFRDIHPNFIKKLSSMSEGNLSPAEMRLGMLLRLNLSSKEIASILRVTPDSVRVARHRLRKKLPIDQKKELVNFMVEL